MLPTVNIFGCAVQSYYLCAALSGACGILLSVRTLRQEGPGAWRFLLGVLTALFVLIGARLLNFLLHPAAYGADFPIWSLSYRKLSLMGGLIFGVAAVSVFGICTKRSPLRLMDRLVLPAGVGIALLKLGCFLNGCCFGKPTEGILGVTFPANAVTYDYLDTLPLLGGQIRTVYPTELFEMAGALAGVAVVWYICRRRRPPDGTRAILFAAWFTLVRLAVHPLRAFPYGEFVTDTVYPLLYALMLLVETAGLVALRRGSKTNISTGGMLHVL